ncbi:MAG: SpoIIE family protein phosphatase [bacterium]|nr:SpoIIE family protein phosphatase [bacterium]
MTLALVTSLFYLTLGLILLLFGLLILRENPRQQLNRVTGVMIMLAGTAPVFAAFGLMLQNLSAVRIDLNWFRKLFLVWEFFFPQMFLFTTLYPRPVEWFRRHRFLRFAIFLPHVVHFGLVMAFSSPEQIQNLLPLQGLTDRFGLLVQPLVILVGLFLNLLSLIYQFHANFFALINLLYIVGANILLTLGYRGIKAGRFRRQVAIVLWGIRASVGLYAVAILFPALNLFATSRTAQFSLITAALLIGCGSIGWAIIRYQFLDIRLIIRRGLVFSLASAVLVGVYLQIYRVGKAMITRAFGAEIPVFEILFILVAMFLFQPVLGLFERLIEKLFMRDRMDYRNVLKDLSHDILTTIDPAALRAKVARTLMESQSVESVELFHAAADGRFVPFGAAEGPSFRPRAEVIDRLKEAGGPIEFDFLAQAVRDERALDVLRRSEASLLIPLVARDRLVGLLSLGRKVARTRFTSEDLTLLSVLGNQTAIAVENSRLYNETLEKQRIEEDLQLAREIQRNLLPKSRPHSRHFELAGLNLPSREVGGDYYDFIPLDGDRMGIVIGDISGKGVPAAILMSNLQAAFRISAMHARTTAEAVRAVNNQIVQTTAVEKFATLFYGVFDPATNAFEYTNAGHNFPYHWKRGNRPAPLREGGLVVGVVRDAAYRSASTTLGPGDILVLYTDGVTEARNRAEEEYGEARLLETVAACVDRPAEGILDSILDSVVRFSGTESQSDDLTLVVMKMK